MSADKDKSKVHKLSLKGSNLALSKTPYQMLTDTIGSSKLIAEFVGQISVSITKYSCCIVRLFYKYHSVSDEDGIGLRQPLTGQQIPTRSISRRGFYSVCE